MIINGVTIEETFAEAFPMKATRVIITAQNSRWAMRIGIEAVCKLGTGNGVRRITAGNYGGKLGPYHFHLREIMSS